MLLVMKSRIPNRVEMLVCAACAAAAFLILILYRECCTSHQRLMLLNVTPSSVIVSSRRFAVFSCATSLSVDYAFYLPLTVLAWRRIGFESIILIVGEKSQWEIHPVLSHVLDTLTKLSDICTVLFLSADVENHVMLSQTARIFVANLKEFPGSSSDFIMTTDADLWPLRREHYHYPVMNRSSSNLLMLLHSECCGSFTLGGRDYTMLPISNVGASAATWKEIINVDDMMTTHSAAENILDYFKKMFGERVRNSVVFASDDWFMDQKMMSVRIDQWIHRQNSSSSDVPTVYKVSDSGYFRIDRSDWNVDEIQPYSLANYYDAHLILDGFMPDNWNKSIQPLLRLMYGGHSTLYAFCNTYATQFYAIWTRWETNNNNSS